MATTTPPAITALPAAPDPNNRATFNTLAYPWSAALPAFGTQVSAVGANVKANADEAEADAIATAADRVQTGLDRTAAASSASTANTKAGEAFASATAAAQSTIDAAALLDQFDDRYLGVKATDPTLDNDGNALAAGAIYVNSVSGFLRAYTGSSWVQGISAISGVSSVNSLTGAVTVQDTLVSGTNIKTLNGASLLGAGDFALGSSLLRSARTANTILGTADNGNLIDITSGTFSQTFDAVATLGDGWFCYLKNSGTGDITLDPNASELIDGLASYVVYPGECRLVQCDGVALRSVVVNAFYKTFTASGSFTKPPGYQAFSGLLWSAGSSGQKSTSPNQAGGGGGGGCFPFSLLASLCGASETVTIGAGGAAQTSVANGLVGGSSSIGSIFTVYPGPTWTAGGAIGSNGYAITASSQAIGFEGASASPSVLAASSVWGGASSSSANPAYVGNSIYGGGGGGVSYGSGTGVAAGTSKLGGNGGSYGYNTSGTSGSAPGGGGGATSGGSQSGAGGNGELRIWGII